MSDRKIIALRSNLPLRSVTSPAKKDPRVHPLIKQQQATIRELAARLREMRKQQ
jgi:hypothetical protein